MSARQGVISLAGWAWLLEDCWDVAAYLLDQTGRDLLTFVSMGSLADVDQVVVAVPGRFEPHVALVGEHPARAGTARTPRCVVLDLLASSVGFSPARATAYKGSVTVVTQGDRFDGGHCVVGVPVHRHDLQTASQRRGLGIEPTRGACPERSFLAANAREAPVLILGGARSMIDVMNRSPCGVAAARIASEAVLHPTIRRAATRAIDMRLTATSFTASITAFRDGFPRFGTATRRS